MRSFLNLGQRLVANGILRKGEPRHCSDWKVGYAEGNLPGIPLPDREKVMEEGMISPDAARRHRALVNVLRNH